MVKKAMIKSSACIFAPFMLIMGFFIGKSAFQETSLDKALELKEKGTVSGIIKDVRLSKEYLSVTVTDAKIELNGQVFEKSKDVLAYVTLEGKYGNTTVCYNKEIISDEMEVADYLKPGSEVSIEGKLSSFSKPTNPGQFNQWSYRKSQGYAAKISSKKVFISERGETSFLSKMKCGIYGLRRSAYKAIEELFPERESGIIKAMLLADKGDMEEDTYLLFSDGGITHILAVSGLHVSLFAGALLYIAGMLKMGFYPSIALTAVFLFSYGLLTGFPVSALRAITMTLIMLFGRLTGKSYDALTGAAITAFMILVKNPLMLYNPSFLLSFGAVAGIFLFQPIFSKLIKGCFGREYKWLKKESLSVKILIFIMEGICLSFSVTLMTLPIVLWFYFKVSVYAVLLNLVIVPLMTLLLILIAAAISLFYVVLPAARIIAGGPYFILTMYEKLCGISTSLPGNSVLFGRPEKAGIVVYYAILMAVYVMLYLYIKMYEKEKSRNDFEERNVEDKHEIRELNKAEKKAAGRELSIMKLLIPAGMVLMLVLFTVFGKPRVSDAKIAFLDVGQGDGSVILTKNLCITIDGGSTTETNIGKYRIKPYIMSNGRNAIDYAFISHSDTDHLSGILELIEDKSFKVKMIVLGDITEAEKDDNYQKLVRCAEENGTKVGFVSVGMSFELEGVTALCLNPQKGKIYGDANDTSEVFFLKALGMNFLYTGDLSAEFETDVINELRKYTDEKVDVLKAGHHGSKSSSSSEFLKEISPHIEGNTALYFENGTKYNGEFSSLKIKYNGEFSSLKIKEKVSGLSILSAGKGNSYGHPSREAMERLSENGYYLHSTIENGALIIE
ncbi:MAG: DNA internalization-related competence protein ComEC/Rec2 [Lachnospiraceae bacterium]|nr:DNA internalization-related competence protein ComEC/Rec2 [Lachnospiraceae bacterium]